MSADVKAIADKLYDYCRTGQTDRGLDELYDEEVVSVEAMPMPGQNSAAAVGLEALRGKHAWWYQNNTIHGSDVAGPFVHGDDRFALIFWFDSTDKASGKRQQMREIGVYTIGDGKIVREEFYYG